MLKYIRYILSREYEKLLLPYLEEMNRACAWQNAEVSIGRASEYEAGAGTEDRESTLFITDIPPILNDLLDKGAYAAAFWHEGNRDGDFSRAAYLLEDVQDMEYRQYDEIFRRLAGLPWDILSTDRCLIRETTVEDVDDFYQIYKDSSITRYMESLYPEAEQEKAYIREYIEKIYGFYGFGVWTVIKKDTGEIIGRAGFSYREGFEDPEIGFVIGTPWQRQGLAYEVCTAILRYGALRLGFERVQALVEPGNAASLNLCEKLGMRQEGTVFAGGREYIRLISMAVG